MSEMKCRACGENCVVESWSIPYSDKGEQVDCAWCNATLFVVAGASAHRVYKTQEEKMEADARAGRHGRWRNW